jgi:2'-5' RNA ligase
MSESWRLFIAIELPDELSLKLRDIQDRLKKQPVSRAVRWVDPRGIHLTLKFLGDVPVAQRDPLQRVLERAVEVHAPFGLTAQEFGCFPNHKRPRVLWVGITGEIAALQGVRAEIESTVSPLGFPTEDRPFSPHLTLGRVRQEASREEAARAGAMLAELPATPLYDWQVNQVSLIRSELKPSGAVYTPIFHVALGGNRT